MTKRWTLTEKATNKDKNDEAKGNNKQETKLTQGITPNGDGKQTENTLYSAKTK